LENRQLNEDESINDQFGLVLSTGSICVDIATVLEKKGHECYIAYGQGTTTYHKSFKIGTLIENHLHNLGSRITGKQGYFTKKGTHKLIEFIKEYQPD
jgi:hypothetical protein